MGLIRINDISGIGETTSYKDQFLNYHCVTGGPWWGGPLWHYPVLRTWYSCTCMCFRLNTCHVYVITPDCNFHNAHWWIGGLCYYRTAQEVENIVRKHGAVPATIAMIDGVISIGLFSPFVSRWIYVYIIVNKNLKMGVWVHWVVIPCSTLQKNPQCIHVVQYIRVVCFLL